MKAGVILFPGAGTSANHQSLVAIETSLKRINPKFNVRRVDFPYRSTGKSFPDRTPVMIECVRDAIQQAAKDWCCEESEIVVGGRSMGGRMCSMAIAQAEQKLEVAALVCICYPLHPPKKPENLRSEHLPRITVPTLFISGTRDEFGTVDELKNATATMKTKVTHEWIEGARHDLKNKDEVVADLVAGWVGAL